MPLVSRRYVSIDLRFRVNSLQKVSVMESDKLPKSLRPKEITTIHCGEHMVRDLEV
jgi:hypothetical protein